MRGGKDEEKMVSPMFPRLHINDTDKGGPRAPPRNKMALYEQLSIPTQRVDSGSLSSSSVLPLPPNKGSSLVPSVSSNHAGSHERNFLNPCGNSLPEKHIPRPHGTFRPSSLIPGQEHKSLNVTKDEGLIVPQPLSSGPKDRSVKSSFSNFKNSSWKTTEEKSDFTVPSHTQAGAAMNHGRIRHIKDFDNQPRLSLASPLQLQHASDEPKRKNSVPVPKAIALSEAQSKERENQTIKDSLQRSTSVASVRSKRSLDASLALPAKVKCAELLKEAHPSSNQSRTSHSLDVPESLLDGKARSSQSASARQNMDVPKVKLLVDPTLISMKSPVAVRIELNSRSSLRNDDKISRSGCQGNGHGFLQTRDSERCDTVSKTSLGQSVYALEITPDDVVRALGEKQFWKARQAIVSQQRVFVLQVFELHKLIKVQKLIAASPDALLEGNLYLGKAPSKVSPLKRLSSERHNKESLLVCQLKDLSPKRHCSTEAANKNAVGKLLFPSIHSETSKVISPPQSNYGLPSENAPRAPSPANIRQPPSCSPLMGNQWLVPVMSPSEGLVYKPYSGPCPLPGSFLAPTYGNCNPMSLTAGSADFLNTGYGMPAPHQQGMGVLPAMGQTYFPPYGIQANQLSSGSVVEQMSSLNGPMHKDIQFLVGDDTFPCKSPSNLSSQASRVIQHRVGRFQSSKESEKQGSSASSPVRGATADALPLFPVEPTVKPSDQNDQPREPPSRVIKVVPHNPRTAVESAARIFRSIQMERLQCD